MGVDRYLFHASAARRETDEYNNEEDDEVEVKDEALETDTAPSVASGSRDAQEAEVKTKTEIADDASLAEWFNVEPTPPTGSPNASDTETDDDSDNADVINADQGVADDLDMDDWLQVGKHEDGADADTLKSTPEKAAKVSAKYALLTR